MTAPTIEELEEMAQKLAIQAEFLQQKVEALDAEATELKQWKEKVEAVARTGTVQNWLKLPDEEKAKWFAMHVRESNARKELEIQLAHMGESLRDEVTARLDAEDRAEKAARRLAERDELLKRASKALLLGFPDLAGEICDATAKTWSDAAAAATPADPATPE